jgi:hypothetical protein
MADELNPPASFIATPTSGGQNPLDRFRKPDSEAE